MDIQSWDKTKVKKELLLVIEQLTVKRTALADLTNKRVRKEVRRHWMDIRLAQLEAPITIEVCSSVNENGKPMYGNEALRQAAIQTCLAKNPEISTLTRRAGLYQKLGLSDLRYDEAMITLEVKKLEAIERLLFVALEE